MKKIKFFLSIGYSNVMPAENSFLPRQILDIIARIVARN